VAIFDEDGNSSRNWFPAAALRHLGDHDRTRQFRHFGTDVLIGNFSFKHSEINAFIPSSGQLEGQSRSIPALPRAPMDARIRVGGNNGRPDVLYFSDGIDGETHGLFGAIQ